MKNCACPFVNTPPRRGYVLCLFASLRQQQEPERPKAAGPHNSQFTATGWIFKQRRHRRSGVPAREQDATGDLGRIRTHPPQRNVLERTPDPFHLFRLD
ncbi:hypothetical protein SKAU_G00091990 [Synaphobranchus kaupii]|uniref:Uncharacterized protein n=1 Tax=Synaphobranchus kaupii TaxID=118154 RepID=A0A9Q1FXS3_SYNKA|nr:hypothetical protein SKAU_G00091990 [Synaphobranchus kaupii]